MWSHSRGYNAGHEGHTPSSMRESPHFLMPRVPLQLTRHSHRTQQYTLRCPGVRATHLVLFAIAATEFIVLSRGAQDFAEKLIIS